MWAVWSYLLSTLQEQKRQKARGKDQENLYWLYRWFQINIKFHNIKFIHLTRTFINYYFQVMAATPLKPIPFFDKNRHSTYYSSVPYWPNGVSLVIRPNKNYVLLCFHKVFKNEGPRKITITMSGYQPLEFYLINGVEEYIIETVPSATIRRKRRTLESIPVLLIRESPEESI